MSDAELPRVVVEAARRAGIGSSGAELLRSGSNAMYLLPVGVVLRVGRPGHLEVAEREVRIARWLASQGLSVTEPILDIEQPTVFDDRPITWWRAIPAHRAGSPAELGALLRELHALPLPEFPLPRLDPFTGLDLRIDGSPVLDEADRVWLRTRSRRLRDQLAQVAPFRPDGLVHGDAWQGNIAVPVGGVPVLLDFERTCIGDPAWDLIQIAVDHVDFERIDDAGYREFKDAYGGEVDVRTWPGFRCCADIQELRWVVFALGMVEADRRALPQLTHRIACLRGDVPKPWTWTAF